MKKSVLSMVWAMTLLLGMMCVPSMTLEANESLSYDHSYLTEQSYSKGELILKTRGVYMQSGSTAIAKSGKGILEAVGDTTGQQVVDLIKVAVIVERWNASDNTWRHYYSWEKSENNSYFVTTSRTLQVPRGYYYRVRGIHSANSDSGYSYTNGIWFG